MRLTACVASLLGALAVAPPARAADCDGIGPPTATAAWRAELAGRTPVYPRPGARARRTVDAGAWLVLGVRERDDRCWVRIRLPSRPNTASGWVNVDRVAFAETPWRLVVHTRSRRLDVLRHGERVRRVRVVVGAPATPTPRGLFAVAEVVKWRPREFLGAWVLTLTAHSDVLRHFDGGDGRVAIHGRGGASFKDPLGSARSHGCVRMTNDAISWIVRTIGEDDLPGVPVAVD